MLWKKFDLILFCLHVLWFVYSLTSANIVGIQVIYVYYCVWIRYMIWPHPHMTTANSSSLMEPSTLSSGPFRLLHFHSVTVLQECGQSRRQLETSRLHCPTTLSPRLTTTEQWCLEDPLRTGSSMTHMCLTWRHGYGVVCVCTYWSNTLCTYYLAVED